METKEIKTLLKNGKIAGLTLDTDEFKHHNLRLKTGLLAQLNQFSSSSINLYLPDIVLKELEINILKKYIKAEKGLLRALDIAYETATWTRKQNQGISKLTFGAKPNVEGMKNLLHEFSKNTDLKIIPSDQYVQFNELLQAWYKPETFDEFEFSVPKFTITNTIAALNIANWARKQDQYILVVSSNIQWRRINASRDRLIFLNDLSEALNLFQTNPYAHAVSNHFSSALCSDSKGEALLDSIEDLLQQEFMEIFWEVKDTIDQHFSLDLIGLFVEDFVFERKNNRLAIPIYYSPNKIIISSNVLAYVVLATLNEFIDPHMGKTEHLPWDSEKPHTIKEFDLTCLLTLEGNFENDQTKFEISKLEIATYKYRFDIQETQRLMSI